MEIKIVLTDLKPYDGEYPLEIETLTMNDLRTVKRLSGVRAGEIGDALGANDTDVILALAVVAADRAGKTLSEEKLWNAQFGSIKLIIDEGAEEGADAEVPPAVEPQTTGPPGNGGESSNPVSATSPESPPSSTGSHDSERSVTSPRIRSVG